MKMNKLSFYTNPMEIEEGWGIFNYRAFYFQVDGETIQCPDDGYHPASCYDLVDDEAEKESLIVLWHCSCGFWQCSSIVAYVKVSDDTIQWDVKQYRVECNPSTYYFKRDEYEKVMAEIMETARREVQLDKEENDR